MNIVELKNVCKTYPAFCLHNVSFALKSGTITGFIGRNGAGKTTTIKSMLNLIHTDSGEISYFGMPLFGHETEIKQQIGYSTGTVSWYPRKTMREITEVTRSFYPGWDEEAYRSYLTLFGLDESKKPIELSEGMKVKFNLLLALSHKAEVLILDEPTSGLDPFSRDELLELFMTLKEYGLPSFFPRISRRIWSAVQIISSISAGARSGRIVPKRGSFSAMENRRKRWKKCF